MRNLKTGGSSGTVTPNNVGAIGACIRATGTQTLTTATWTQITGLSTIEFKNGLTVTSTNITADVAGTYLISTGVSHATNAAGARFVYYKVNGSFPTGRAAQSAPGVSTDNLQLRGVWAAELNIGDVVTLWAYQDTGGNNDIADGELSLVLLSTKQESPVSASIKNTTTQSYTSGTTPTLYNQAGATTTFNNGCTIDASDTSITVTQDGVYQIVVFTQFASNATGRRATGVSINGTSKGTSLYQADATGAVWSRATFILQLSAGGKIQANGYQNSGGSLNCEEVDIEVTQITATRTNPVDSCSLYLTAHQSITSGSYQTINWTGEEYNSVGVALHSTSTNNSRLYAISDGLYLITVTIRFANNATGDRLVVLRKNGTTFPGGCFQPANINGRETYVPVSWIVKLVAGDYVEIQAQQTSGGALDVQGTDASATNITFTRLATFSDWSGGTVSGPIQYGVGAGFGFARPNVIAQDGSASTADGTETDVEITTGFFDNQYKVDGYYKSIPGGSIGVAVPYMDFDLSAGGCTATGTFRYFIELDGILSTHNEKQTIVGEIFFSFANGFTGLANDLQVSALQSSAKTNGGTCSITWSATLVGTTYTLKANVATSMTSATAVVTGHWELYCPAVTPSLR